MYGELRYQTMNDRRPPDAAHHAHDRMAARAGAMGRAAFMLTVDYLSFPWLFIGGPVLVVLVAFPMAVVSAVLFVVAVAMYMLRPRPAKPLAQPEPADSVPRQ